MMSFLIKISIVPVEEKYEKVKLVQPNIIYNRFDIKYNGDFEVLKIEYKKCIQYVAIHIHSNKKCYIGIYMTELEQCVFDKMISFITKKYGKKINKIHVTQGLIKNSNLENKMHWLLNLPDTVEEYWAQFSSQTRHVRRKRLSRMQNEYDVSFEHYEKHQINEQLITLFFKLKSQTEDDVCYNTNEEGVTLFLSDFYHITDVYVIKINDKIEAMQLCSVTDKNDVYFENLTYNKEFSNYGLGMMAYYYAIEQLIERGYKRIYLGGGDYSYKKDSKAVKSETMSGDIILQKTEPIIKKIFNCRNSKNHKIIIFLGVKIKLRRKEKSFSKIKLFRCFFIKSNIKGKGNKIRSYYRNKWHNINLKYISSNFWIKGNNNIVKFHFKTKKLPKGLDLTINGSNNVIDIYKSAFKNTYIQIYRDKNTLEIKEQTFQTVSGAHIYVSYGGSMFIGKDCELGNGGLELAVAGDYIEKHKMIIGNNTHIAKDTIIRTSDGQSLIDPETMLPTDPPEDVIIGNNVWIMSRCIILKGSYIPDGCAVAASSLVNKKFEEENVLLLGTPAKIFRRNIRWGAPYGKYMEQFDK